MKAGGDGLERATSALRACWERALLDRPGAVEELEQSVIEYERQVVENKSAGPSVGKPQAGVFVARAGKF